MKRLINWFRHNDTTESTADSARIMDDVHDACMTSGPFSSGVNIVMTRYYRESVF